MHLFQVLFLVSVLLYSCYDSALLSLYWKVVAGYFALKFCFLNRSKFNSTRRMIQIATFGDHSSPMTHAVLSVNVTKAVQYVNSMKVSGRAVSLTDVLLKAVGKVVEENTDLKGNLVFGLFFPSKTANVALLVSDSPVEGDPTIHIDAPGSRSVPEIADQRVQRTIEMNKRNSSSTQGFPGFYAYLPSSILSLVVSFQEFWLCVGIALGRTRPVQALLTEVGYVGEMMALMSPPPLFKGALVLTPSTVAEEVVVDERDSPAIAQVIKLGVNFDYRYISHPRSLQFLQQLKTQVEGLRDLLD